MQCKRESTLRLGEVGIGVVVVVFRDADVVLQLPILRRPHVRVSLRVVLPLELLPSVAADRISQNSPTCTKDALPAELSHRKKSRNLFLKGFGITGPEQGHCYRTFYPMHEAP
jgi:hypothetical protein